MGAVTTTQLGLLLGLWAVWPAGLGQGAWQRVGGGLRGAC